MRIVNADRPLIRRQGDLFGNDRAHRPAAKSLGDELLALMVGTAKRQKISPGWIFRLSLAIGPSEEAEGSPSPSPVNSRPPIALQSSPRLDMD